MLFFASLFIPSPVFAADTCCVGHGGNYACNVATSKLYCKDGTVSTKCICHAAPTPTPTATPTPIPTVTPPPVVCPAFASYSANKHACICNTGYVVNNSVCVSYAQYCRTKYGNNSAYNASSKACGCSQGYTWNSKGTTCVTMDAVCNEKLGNKSYYNSADKSCYCYQGYAIQNGTCRVMPTPLPPPATVAPTKGVPVVPPTAAPVPTIAAVIVPTHAQTVIPTKKPVPTIDLHKKVPRLHGYVLVKKKKSNGFFADLLSNIWQAILKAFNIY